MWQLYLVIGYLFDVLIELHPVIKVENSYLEIVYFNKFQRKKKSYMIFLPITCSSYSSPSNKKQALIPVYLLVLFSTTVQFSFPIFCILMWVHMHTHTQTYTLAFKSTLIFYFWVAFSFPSLC